MCILNDQCKKHRGQFTEEKKAVYEEKLEASEIFKDKKALYPSRYIISSFFINTLHNV